MKIPQIPAHADKIEDFPRVYLDSVPVGDGSIIAVTPYRIYNYVSLDFK